MEKSRHLLSLSRGLRSLGERSLREWGASVRSPPRFSFSHRPRPLPLYCFPDVYSDRGPMFPAALLFLRPASAFMGTRCLQAHRVGCLLLVHISSYRLPSSSPRASSRRLAEAPNRDISASSGYLPTPVSLCNFGALLC